MLREFEIFSKPSAPSIAVKRGFCWPGFFFGCFWALARGLWLQGSVLLACSVGFVFVAFAAPILSTDPWLRVFFTVLGWLIALVAGFKGNGWRSNKLERTGYHSAGVVSARSSTAALSIVARGGQAEARPYLAARWWSSIPIPRPFQRLVAVAWLTLKAAVRLRLVLVLATVLIGAVVILPLVIKDDGTARGFTQILLTYTLATITALLGFATLWMACGTLARDIEEAQIQVVVVKPVARWQIWLGKWLGILVLNAALLALSSGAVYLLMQWRAQKLPPEQQAILRNEVMVARGSVREPVPDFDPAVEEELKKKIQSSAVPLSDLAYMRNQIREQFKAQEQVVPPEHLRRWALEVGTASRFSRDQPLYLRVKFNVAQTSPSKTYLGLWAIGELDSARLYQTNMSLAADTFHEIIVPPNLVNDKGQLIVNFINRNETAVLFPLEEGMEVLYREGGFGLNYFRGVSIIFFWLAFLGALGLAASSFLSFPVAAFLSLGVLIIGMCSGTISLVLEQGTVFEVNHDTGVADKTTLIDQFALPIFRVLLHLINMVKGFSPIDSLSTGRSISWGQLGQAFAQICLCMGGILCASGMMIFNRRELASAQGNH
ncbi:MAG: DUF2628 domain-containing protein [Verrucomicrobia bacterium]|nr:DUF2628 domain-containing protein [Verrucomicrobiota bacterium]